MLRGSFSLLSRNQFPKLHSLANYKSFTTIQTPRSFNISNTHQDSNYRNKISLVNLFQRYGFPSSVLLDFIAKNKYLLNSNLSELEQSLGILLLSFKLQQNSIVSIVCNCPSVLELKFLKKWEIGFVSLGQFAKSSGVMKNVLEVSRMFQIDPDRFSNCVEVLRGLGFSDATISRVLEEFPRIVTMDNRELKKKVEFWTMQGFEREVVDGIYYSFPRVLQYRIENRLNPLLIEFKDLGFSRCEIREELVKEPKILGFEVGELRWYLELLRRLRCRQSTKEEIFSKGEFKAGLAAKQRIDCLCEYGLIRRDALNILKREPRLMIYDIQEIKTKVEFLLRKMGFSIDSLIQSPEYLGVSFEKQIVPRYNVIEYLRLRGGIGFELGLKDIIKPTRLKFYNLYVKPYPECEKLYGRFSEHVEKSRHPVGLWKCFKPPKYPDSQEDLKNLRLFSELTV